MHNANNVSHIALCIGAPSFSERRRAAPRRCPTENLPRKETALPHENPSRLFCPRKVEHENRLEAEETMFLATSCTFRLLTRILIPSLDPPPASVSNPLLLPQRRGIFRYVIPFVFFFLPLTILR